MTGIGGQPLTRTRAEAASLIVEDLVRQGIPEQELRRALDNRAQLRRLGAAETSGQRPGQVVQIAPEYRPGAPITRPRWENDRPAPTRALMSWVEVEPASGWEVSL
ncbi:MULTISPECIES: hypothetical protein [Nocardia]|uniref:Uncharacterized protein n=1 Tax=Nocardia nova TaxID=37330 RepID=A0A2T2ZE66_9NOCA|nr:MULTISPECIES: hypothetical protein [Nocardia]PSR66016.1 hypothetical protein C8259_01255 [Nocardia nova]